MVSIRLAILVGIMAVKLVSADVSVSVQNSATNSLSESSGILYSGEKTYGTLRRTSHPVPAETTHPPPTNTKPPSTIHSSNGCVCVYYAFAVTYVPPGYKAYCNSGYGSPVLYRSTVYRCSFRMRRTCWLSAPPLSSSSSSAIMALAVSLSWPGLFVNIGRPWVLPLADGSPAPCLDRPMGVT
ncbi:hypothetical protein PF008_g6424 [Phytophthora fragariae]|uniref:RxLR effector protein n=1 Tax=Phytophthora fragariae TaxID=53985 RepID=A0A6G0S5N1_9STRA|nr:hypothetical protein PF008_g6424 [Phytophthora fragariae]